MPETEADRILRERLRQRETQGRREQAEQERQARITYQRYFDDINAEINAVLRLLAELKKYGDPELTYPFMQEVRLRKYFLYDFYFTVTKAGWVIGSCEINPGGRGDGGFSVPLYLLSDGHLCCNNSVGSPEKIIGLYGRPSSYDSTGCLKGLQDLRKKLEEMKRRKLEKMNK